MGKIAEIQRILGVDPDDEWGPRSQAALEAAEEEGKRPTPNAQHPTSNAEGGASHSEAATAVDARSAGNIATLLPPVRPLAVALILALREAGIAAKVISGNRTYAEQDALYAQGRTKPGARVTNARGGQSNHNFGVAFDIGIFDANGKYWEESPAYAKAGETGKKLGLQWGGDWTFQDEPHFEWRPDWAKDLNENEALAAYRARHEKQEPIA